MLMKNFKPLIIDDYVNEFRDCKFLITREYKIRVEKRFFITLIAVGLDLLLARFFVESWVLLLFGVLSIATVVLFFVFPLAKISVYIIDTITQIRHSGDIDYDFRKRRSEIRQILKDDFGSYISRAGRDNCMPLVVLQAKQIIDRGDIITKSPD